MWPILIASILAAAIFLERIWSLRQSRTIPQAFLKRLRSLLERGQCSEALAACEENDSALARIIAAAIRNREQGREKMREAVELSGRVEVAMLERFVSVVSIVANLEPLLGLLGTVLGLITAFQSIEKAGVMGDPTVVARGVWEALLTTAAGLFAAIPAYIMHKTLRGRINVIVLEMEEHAFEIVELLEFRQKYPLPPQNLSSSGPVSVPAAPAEEARP
ncbi:MAG: hypothetical protein GMKNLPBB_01082 [Myxococcota bacterium]|nr:hypothetical protein [Myxococcota bacterium]